MCVFAHAPDDARAHCYRFEGISSLLTLVDPAAAPAFEDLFWTVRAWIKAWNENMAANFIPSTISCLDESMMAWINPVTNEGFKHAEATDHFDDFPRPLQATFLCAAQNKVSSHLVLCQFLLKPPFTDVRHTSN